MPTLQFGLTSRFGAYKPYLPYTFGNQLWLHVPAVKTGTSKKFASQWCGPYTIFSVTNYLIKLIGSPSKNMVVHLNRLKLCYGTPQQSTITPTPLNSTQPSYAEVVHHTESEPIGGYTCSSDNSSRDVIVLAATRPLRNCGPPSRYSDFVPP